MVHVLSAAEVHAALDWVPLSDALEAAFARGAHVPVRHAHSLGAQGSLLLMPAWNQRLLVTKIVTVIPDAAHTVQATLLACDRRSGRPLAVLDGEAVTLRRTAATSALAARHMARPDASRLLVVGAGRLSSWMARAHAALRPGLRQVDVWARRPESAHAVARGLRDEGLPARAVEGDLEGAVRAAHIVCCATTSRVPLVREAWLAPGTHLDLVGGFRPDMREVDDETVARAHVVVDTLEAALSEAGDLVQPLARGVIGAGHVAADLGMLVRGRVVGRPDAAALTVFKSVGTALADLAAAELVIHGRRGGG
jgi:ornithine cyclodeaminase